MKPGAIFSIAVSCIGLNFYFQVTYKLSGSETISREFGNLQAIKDAYQKYVITMEDITGPLKEYPGIHHIHLRDFLKMDF